jgi:hypothetical protein
MEWKTGVRYGGYYIILYVKETHEFKNVKVL